MFDSTHIRFAQEDEERHVKFTQQVVERLAPPSSGRIMYWDILLPGFGLRVSAPDGGGHIRKAWCAMYRVGGKLVFETIGRMTLIPTVEEARERARDSMRMASAGVNPVEHKRRIRASNGDVLPPKKDPSLLMPAVIDRYLSHYQQSPKKNGKPRRPSTVRRVNELLVQFKEQDEPGDEQQVADGLCWKFRYIDDLTYDDIKSCLIEIGDAGFKVKANRTLQVLKPFFDWAVTEKLVPTNPIAGLSRLYPEVVPDRSLNDAEIRAFWWGCQELGYPYGPMFQLLLLTATRRDEVGGLPIKGEIGSDGKRIWNIPPERTKNDQRHLVYLTDLMMRVIDGLPRIAESKFMFASATGNVANSFSYAKQKLDALMVARLRKEDLGSDEELEHWTLNSLRHTARSNFPRLKIADHVAERLLNHKIPGVRGRYDHWKYFDEKKDALKRWSALVQKIISRK